MKRMSVVILATLFLAGYGESMAFAPPHDALDTASGPNSRVVAPAGATFFDDFSKGKLDTSKWIASNWELLLSSLSRISSSDPGQSRFFPFLQNLSSPARGIDVRGVSY
jgi:hypothetical protein